MPALLLFLFSPVRDSYLLANKGSEVSMGIKIRNGPLPREAKEKGGKGRVVSSACRA